MTEKFPITPAVRALRKAQVAFDSHLYEYEDKGGTESSAQALHVEEHGVIKTLIMEDDQKQPLVVLMHGDKQVSTKQLARLLGRKTITPCSPEVAQKHSGYLVGGTSPLGTRQAMPVYMEQTIAELPQIYINGGKRGYLVSLSPQELIRILKPTLVQVAI